jgi:hypothetical protein
VIVHLDAHRACGRDNLAGDGDMLGRGLGIAAGMIVQRFPMCPFAFELPAQKMSAHAEG